MHLPALSRSQLAVGCLSTAALVVLVASPGLFRDRVSDALGGLGHASPGWLWLAAAALAAMHVSGAFAWGVALRACNAPVRHLDTLARYGVGSGVNAIAPAHLGSAVRVALFARVSGDGGVWCVGGAGAAVGAVRAVWTSALVIVAVSTGIVPVWPMVVIGTLLAGAVGVAVVSRRTRVESRIGRVLLAFRELGRRPRSLAALAALTFAGTAAKLVGAACVLTSLGIDHPVIASVIVVPAIELAAIMPLTPGNAGVASAAAAIALGAQGVARDTALAAGIAFGAVETITACGIGLASVLFLAGPVTRPAVRLAAAGAAATLIGMGFTATVLVPLG